MKRSLILVTGGILFFATPLIADAAVLSIFPERAEAVVGQTVRLEVGIDTEGERVNAVQAWVLVPPELELIGVETGGSLIDLWIEEPSYSEGMVRLSGGLTGGFAGRGLIGSIIVRPTAPGVFGATFDQGSTVLLHDGQGTSAVLVREGTSFRVAVAPTLVVRSPSHPEGAWRAEQNAIVEWTPRDGVVYSWSLDNVPETIPDTNAEETTSPLEIQGLGDGMHYFHIREGLPNVNGSYVWGDTVHLRIMVDTTAPRSYEPLRIASETVMVPARDDNAGIMTVRHRWEAIWSPIDGTWYFANVWEPMRVPLLLRWFGGDFVTRAVDQAGNMREQRMPIPGHKVAQVLGLITTALIILGVLRWLVRLFHKQANR